MLEAAASGHLTCSKRFATQSCPQCGKWQDWMCNPGTFSLRRTEDWFWVEKLFILVTETETTVPDFFINDFWLSKKEQNWNMECSDPPEFSRIAQYCSYFDKKPKSLASEKLDEKSRAIFEHGQATSCCISATRREQPHQRSWNFTNS